VKNAIPLPASFPIQQATHDPPVSGSLRRESPPSSEVGLLDSPNAAQRKARRDHAAIGGDDSVQRVLVRVEGDRPVRLVSLRSLPPDDDDNLSWDDGERTQRPR